jgi:hypothetical protein
MALTEGITLIGLFLLALATFDLAVWCWAVDSRDGLQSKEWERRRDWPPY